jgi:hypothetical protein
MSTGKTKGGGLVNLRKKTRCPLLSMPQKLVKSHANVLDDLSQKDWGHIPALMVWNSGCAPVRMAVLHVRTALTNKRETRRLQNMAKLRVV